MLVTEPGGRWCTPDSDRWRVWVTCFVALLLFGVAVQAQSRIPADRERTGDIVSRARGAQRVVVARVVAVEPTAVRNASGDLLIVSRTTLSVEEVFKGEPAATLVLDVEGGTLGGITLEVSDMPTLVPGDRGVFFLAPTQHGTHALHRRGRGMLRLSPTGVVDTREATGLTLDALRRDLSRHDLSTPSR